jgi:hypothetical protein
MKVWHTYSPKQKILHNLQQRSLYRLHKFTTDHTVRQCTNISEAGPDISIRGIRFISETIFFKEISKDTET